MKIIRSSEQRIVSREIEGRDVRFYCDEKIEGHFDWLMVTRSFANKDSSLVGNHFHPNALELIVFHKKGKLVINSTEYCFEPEDVVILGPEDTHGAEDLRSHDCTCILLGSGQPQKSVPK